MKKYSWILALVVALSMVFMACPPPEPPPPPPEGDLVLESAAEIGALITAVAWHGDVDVSVTGNVLHFNIPTGGSSDNQGFKIDFPQAAKDNAYLSMTVTFKLVEKTTIQAGRKAKIGFKAAQGSMDITPYPDYELHFEDVGDEFSLKFPMNKLPNKALWVSNNMYGDGSPVPVNYKLEITKIVFEGGEATPPECTCEDEDCDCDCEEDCGPTCPDCVDDSPAHPGAGQIVLGDFTWVNNDTQKGWRSDGADNTATDLDFAELYHAKYLVLEMPALPTGGVQLVWQGDGEGGWHSNNILTGTGGVIAEAGTSFDGTNLKIELSKAFTKYDSFLKSREWAKFLIAYYSPDVAALGITKAYLIIE